MTTPDQPQPRAERQSAQRHSRIMPAYPGWRTSEYQAAFDDPVARSSWIRITAEKNWFVRIAP